MLRDVIEPLYRWIAPPVVAVDPACVAIARQQGMSARLLTLLAARGISTPQELGFFLGAPEEALHDPRLLPDAEAAVAGKEGRRQRSAGAAMMSWNSAGKGDSTRSVSPVTGCFRETASAWRYIRRGTPGGAGTP